MSEPNLIKLYRTERILRVWTEFYSPIPKQNTACLNRNLFTYSGTEYFMSEPNFIHLYSYRYFTPEPNFFHLHQNKTLRVWTEIYSPIQEQNTGTSCLNRILFNYAETAYFMSEPNFIRLYRNRILHVWTEFFWTKKE